VSDEVVAGKKKVDSIPERRPSDEERKGQSAKKPSVKSGAATRVWRCSVCGYLCAMEHPPGKCPVCGVNRERFEEFEFSQGMAVCAMENPPLKCPICKADKDRFERFL
jgi:rubrerythrin